MYDKYNKASPTSNCYLPSSVNFEGLDLAFIQILLKEREFNILIEEMKTDESLALINKDQAF